MAFYDYGSDLDLELTQRCTTQAIRDARIVHGIVWNDAIGRDALFYQARWTSSSPIIILSVLPEAAMTWSMLFSVARMAPEFLINHGSMALYCDAEVMNMGLVAKGNITALPAWV